MIIAGGLKPISVCIGLLFCLLEVRMSEGDKSHPRKSLIDFSYKFDEEGSLKEVDENGELTENGFKFDVYGGNSKKNQQRYEELGLVMDQEVYRLLETRAGLERVSVGPGSPQSFVFCSPDLDTKTKVVLLIHGSGVVRAGQWARRLIINEDLDKGTMLPYIKHIQSRGWGVVVTNTNHNEDPDTGAPIPGSQGPEQHAATVWDQLLAGTRAQRIVIIAHSYGGVVTMSLASSRDMSRLAGVFLTDSVHYGLSGDEDMDKRLVKIGKNYVTSEEPVGTRLPKSRDIPRYSAGHTKHEWTSWAAMDNIFSDMDHAFSDSDGVTGEEGDKTEL